MSKDSPRAESLARRAQLIEDHEAKHVGRPCEYDSELVQVILDRLADGESLSAICREPGMPHRTTILRWRRQTEGPAAEAGFSNAYAQARRDGVELHADELFEIADGAEAAGQAARQAAQGDDDSPAAHAAGWRAYREEIEARRLRIDVRKFTAVKLLSDYRDKVGVEHSGDVRGGVLVIPATMTPEEWNAAAQAGKTVGDS